MTPADLLLIVGTFLLALAIAGAVMRALLGPDPDLAAPWTPAEPSPGARRRACLTAGCTVDHARYLNREGLVITRSADHRYTYEGVVYPGVTTILSVLDKSGPLMGWAARQTAEAAVKAVDQLPALLATVGPEGVVKALTARSSWQRDEAAALGTEVHHLADLMVTGQKLPTLSLTTQKRVDAYARWWTASGWRLRLSEAMVILPDEACGFGGTFDLLAYDRDGRTVLADIKTGKAVYSEAVLQLAAYGMAKLVQPANDGILPAKVYPMPKVDRYAILHVTADECREVEISVGTAERMAFLACRELHDWRESMKGKRL